ncbi:MAG TPA: hypothetical protein VFB51_12870 [Solirubrobacterales bacterium]|nr:hypothetical protein [Solirubrobacterales bacterium]
MAGREKAKRERKRRRSNPKPAETAAAEPAAPRKSKDDIAREALVPLEQGERPLVVTIAALIATGMAVSTVVLFAIGVEVQGSESRNPGTLLYATLMTAMAIGLWQARYWAVLGFQTLLALLIVIWSLLLVQAETAVGALLAVAIVALAGTMFWFLVKALARIQMPDRGPPRGG